MPFPRSSGILLHPTSFPSRFGIGDLGLEAYKFIDFLAESSQSYWQVLPLGPTGFGNSPYASYSAIAGNPLLISPELLRDAGLLYEEELANFPDCPAETVDFDRLIPRKMELLWTAYERFTSQPEHKQEEFEKFCGEKAGWLDDYALFMAIKKVNRGRAWNAWEPEVAKRNPETLKACQQCLRTEIQFHKYLQFEFFRQWSQLKRYANERYGSDRNGNKQGIEIIGDIPIYVAHDSADVWSNPEIFCLDDETGEPSLMAGVPPDYFSATGQLWGNPVYHWERLQKDNFKWWIGRFEALLDYVDIIRIDHFRGFEAYWAVKQGEPTALNGQWLKAPGDEFFQVLNQKLGKLPILAEDLGVITPDVEALRDKFAFPGMKILQFAFGSDPGNGFLPFNYVRNSVVYTGTHDNDTTVGWFNSLSDGEKQHVMLYLGCISSEGINWDLIRLALSSISNQAIIPVQDLLGLDTEARMNFPSKAEGNWGWRYRSDALTDEIKERLKTLTHVFGRDPIRQT